MRRLLLILTLCLAAFCPAAGRAEERFPPPEFESGYQMPAPTTPAARALPLQFLDVGVLFAALAVATWLVHRKRSRAGLVALSVFSVTYFGFYRQGCICAIGSVQNIALGIFDRSYAIPLTVLAFLLVPIVVTLFVGRTFCAGVCPHGAIQDLVLLKPVKVPGWLEHGLGLLPFVFLGAGVIFAATGSAFVFCRFDPFVPLFRLSGTLTVLTLGAAFLLVGMFVGRPYCRFLCPYGALLRLASLVSKWQVLVTAGACSRCRLCENSCPYGALRHPVAGVARLESPRAERKRLTLFLVLLPVLIAAGALAGSQVGVPASQLHPTVALAELFARQQKTPVQYAPMTPEALSLERAQADPASLLAAAAQIRQRVVQASWLVGGWIGLVVGLKLITLSWRSTRTNFEPDRGTCLACARCYEDCPSDERCQEPKTAAMPKGAELGPAPAGQTGN